MTNTYLRQALLLLVLALAFFLIVMALLLTSAEEAEAQSGPYPLARHFAGPCPAEVRASGGFWDGCERSRIERPRREHRSRRYERRRSVDFLWRYNRVEGLFLGFRLPRDDWWRPRAVDFLLWGELGYGFSSKAWRYQVGLERGFHLWEGGRDQFVRFTVGAEAHDLTDTQDEWVIPTEENSLAAMLIKEDFQDYYRRTGVSGFLEQNVANRMLVRAEYRDDRYYNMPADPEKRRATNWSLFGGKKEFRPNPLIDECHLRGPVVWFRYDTRDDEEEPGEGWYISGVVELYGREGESDFQFDRAIVDIRRYQPLGYGENFDVRLRAGATRGDVPVQFLFDLGGISTLRGYPFKAFTGNRFVLANFEYRIRTDFDDFPLIIFNSLNLVVFFDAGLAWTVDPSFRMNEGWESLKPGRLKSDVGIALTDRRGRVRLNFARRTDSAGAPIVVTFRLNRPF